MNSFLSAGFVKRLISVQTFFAVLLGSISIQASALPAYACEDLFHGSFWAQSKAPIPRGPVAHLATFSYDADVTIGAAFELARRADPAGAAKAFDAITGSVSQSRLAFVLKSKETSPALRAGVPAGQPSYRFTDLRPEAMSLVFERADDAGFADAQPALKQYLEPALRRAGLGADVVVRGRRLTVRHFSATLSPEKFVSEIALLKKLVKPREIDFHLGLPSDAVEDTLTSKIAGVLQARVTLERLARGEKNAAVDLELDQFLSPYNAHDVEVKRVSQLSDGFDALELGSRLAARETKLPTILPVMNSNAHSDHAFGAVSASLELFAKILGDEQLATFAKETSSVNLEHNDALKTRIRDYLRRGRVIARATAKLLST